MHSNTRHKRAPVVKYTNEYIEELDRTAFYIGHLIPNWPRKKTGGKHQRHKTPGARHSPHSPRANHSPRATYTPHHAAVLKPNIEFKLLFGILREIVPDPENTAIRRAIIDERAPPTFTQDYTNFMLLKFIKKFNVKSILAPQYMINDIHKNVTQKNITIDAQQDAQHMDDQPVKKYDLVITAHRDMVKYANYSNKYVIGYYFNTTPERLEIYRKLYIAIKGETPTVMNIPRETLRANLNGIMKFMAETEDVQHINNTLNAYAVCYTLK